jgi:D-arabinose 1-dehydrogenase-like Zn-dependent alcohol dehydrogenase
MTDENWVYLFSNGTQFMDWMYRNCERCSKYSDDDAPTCDLDALNTYALMEDGSYSLEDAVRLGYDPAHQNRYTWDCPERVILP